MKKFLNIIIFLCMGCLFSCEGLFPPVKSPAISATLQDSGNYNVTMDAGRNGSIFYTLDGSEPKYPESTLYTGELTDISADTTIRAISYCPSGRYSSVTQVMLSGDISSDGVACE